MHRLEDFLSAGPALRFLHLIKRSTILTRWAWRAFRLYQNITGIAPDEHAQLRRMERAAAPPPDGKRVLIFTLRGWTQHLAWETTIARALHVRHAQTLTVLCDRLLPACEPRTQVDDYDSTCDRCMSQASRFLEASGLPHRWLGEFVTPDEVAAFSQQTADLSLDDLRTFMSGGLPIGQLVGASVNRHLLAGQIEPTPEGERLYRRFVTAGLIVQAAARRILDAFKPEVILMMNGLFYAEAILMAMAKAEGITVWAYERAKKVDHLIFARDEPAVKQEFGERWQARADEPLTPEQRAALEDYLEGRAAGQVGIERLWSDMRTPGADESGQPTAVLFTNVLWDTSVYASDIGFTSMADWVIHAVRWFEEHPERQLIVRAHPAEVRVPFKPSQDPVLARLDTALQDLPANVRVVPPDDPLNSYALMSSADVVLVYTSTIGLEAALRGVRAVVAGKTHYRGKGFTLDPDTRAGFDAALEEAFARPRMAGDEIELARRYAYLYFFIECIPFGGLVVESPRSYVTFHYRHNDDLRPGQDAALDAVCKALLTGKSLASPLAL